MIKIHLCTLKSFKFKNAKTRTVVYTVSRTLRYEFDTFWFSKIPMNECFVVGLGIPPVPGDKIHTPVHISLL
jgi:hypothetical protein